MATKKTSKKTSGTSVKKSAVSAAKKSVKKTSEKTASVSELSRIVKEYGALEKNYNKLKAEKEKLESLKKTADEKNKSMKKDLQTANKNQSALKAEILSAKKETENSTKRYEKFKKEYAQKHLEKEKENVGKMKRIQERLRELNKKHQKIDRERKNLDKIKTDIDESVKHLSKMVSKIPIISSGENEAISDAKQAEPFMQYPKQPSVEQQTQDLSKKETSQDGSLIENAMNAKEQSTESESASSENNDAYKPDLSKKKDTTQKALDDIPTMKMRLEKDEDIYDERLVITYGFDNMPDNKLYSKYKNILRKAARITFLGNLNEGLEMFKMIREQNLPNEYKEMIDKNISDIVYYLRGKHRVRME